MISLVKRRDDGWCKGTLHRYLIFSKDKDKDKDKNKVQGHSAQVLNFFPNTKTIKRAKIIIGTKTKTKTKAKTKRPRTNFPSSWSGLVWKRVSRMDVIAGGGGHSTSIFLSIGPFSAW